MDREFLKVAASCLEQLSTENEELTQLVKKAEMVEKISAKLKEQTLISSLDDYLEKVAELKEKTVEELDHLLTFIDVYSPKAQAQFGKLAEYKTSTQIMESASAEERFATSLLM